MANEKHTALQFQLELLRQIPKKRKITADELHKKMAAMGYVRDLRSIQRTLQNLCEQFDIDCDMRDKTYGYSWKPHSKGLDLPILSEQQSLILMLAKQHLAGLLPPNIMASMQSFFEQAERNLIDDTDKKAGFEWLDKVAVAPTSQPLIPATINAQVFAKISTALYQNKMLNVHYKNPTGKSHKANVMPLALVQQGPSTYLVAKYEDGKIFHLALHRFLEAEISTFTFERPKSFKLKQYIAEAHFGFGEGEKIRLTFLIEKNAGFHLTETPLSADQTVSEENERYYRIRATVVESEMLEWWIAKFGDNFQEIGREYI